jgi:CRISPR-associated endonuclease/helicase Cas3
VRIATALNLRTLTLQTRDAYADEIRMSKSELACVIGCKTSMLLHDARSKGVNKSSASAAEQELSSWGVDEDGNPLEDVFDAEGDSELPPEWLDNFLSRKPKMKSVVMAPALVCTIDHLIHAGDPTQQGNHALTNLRLMTSDLILDEIDSYDSSALLSVLQVVAMAGLWGRHVIASSATTSLPVAEALWTAYSLGIRMRSRLFGTSKGAAGKPGKDVWDCEFRVALVDDRNPTRLLVSQPENEIHSRGEFVAWFQQGLFAMLESMGWTRKRPGELIRVKLKDLEKTGDVELANERIMRAISRSSRIMHDRHAWDIEVDGSMHRISIGLVRIANIRNAVKTAVHLLESHEARITKESTGDNNGDASDHDVDLRVACYHSQLPRIQRYLLECELDTILTRKGKAGTGPEASRKLIEAVRLSRSKGFSQTRFIVVATPVEEVGRDHDFDWAIIEPSSTHSIVQTGGRVNRHRLLDFDVPNIGVLQYNFRYAKNVSSDRDMPVFSMPGNETRKIRYREYNLSKLIDWEELNRCGQIDARLRFSSEKHGFASHDDNAIRMAIASTMRQFVQCDHFGWMGAGTYTDTPLREPVSKIPCSMNESQDDKVRYLYKKNGKLVHEWMTIRLNKEIEPEGAWLTWSFDEALDRAKELGLDSLDAFHVELPIYRNSEDSNVSNEEIIERKYVRLGGFGYFQE